MKFLAIDYGEAKIGLAISDENGKMALPYEILANKGFNFVLSYLRGICQKEKIAKIIVGRPLGMKDQVTVQTEKTDKFIKKLGNYLKLPIEVEDERLTSKAAKSLFKSGNRHFSSGRVLSERGRSQSPGRQSPKDHAVAAMIILRDYIQRNS